MYFLVCLFLFLFSNVSKSEIIKPCLSHGGPVRIGEGTGLCTGNYRTTLNLKSASILLYHDSSNASLDYGFGKGFVPSYEQWFQIDASMTTGFLILGDGTQVNFQKHATNNRWYAKDNALSNHWLEFSKGSPKDLMTQTSPLGDVYTYEKVSITLYRLKGYNNRNGLFYNLTRDSLGRVTTIVLYNNLMILISYSNGRVSRIQDVLRNSYSLFYDPSGHLERVQFPGRNRIARLGYTGDLVQSITFPEGDTVRLSYAQGNISTVSFPNSVQCSFQYSASSVTADCTHFKWTEFFDTNGRLVKKVSDGLEELWERERNDELGRVTRYTSPLGSITQYAYGEDSSSRPMAVIYSDGSREEYEFNGFGLPASKTITVNGNTITETITYNPQFNLPSKVTRNGKEFSLEYDGLGNLKTLSDWLGNTITAEYGTKGGNQGKIIKQSDGVLESRYEYDAFGNLSKVYFPNGRSILISSDALGRPTGLSTLPDNGSISYTYDVDLGLSTRKLSFAKSGKREDVNFTHVRNENGTTSIQTRWTMGNQSLFNEKTKFDTTGNVQAITKEP